MLQQIYVHEMMWKMRLLKIKPTNSFTIRSLRSCRNREMTNWATTWTAKENPTSNDAKHVQKIEETEINGSQTIPTQL